MKGEISVVVVVTGVIVLLVSLILIFVLPRLGSSADTLIDLTAGNAMCGGVSKSEIETNMLILDDVNAGRYYQELLIVEGGDCKKVTPSNLDLTLERKQAIFCPAKSATFKGTTSPSVKKFQDEQEKQGYRCI